MKCINLVKSRRNLSEVMELASSEPVRLLAADGRQYILVSAREDEGFESEVARLGGSASFQRFLADRRQDPRRIPLEEVQAEVDRAPRRRRRVARPRTP